MTTRIEPSGRSFQVTLQSGQTVKSDNKQALSEFIATSERRRQREEKYRLAWNKAVELAGPRYLKSGRYTGAEQNKLFELNRKQVEWAIGRVGKSESAFLAALYAFEDPVKGQELLTRVGCQHLRALAEALSPTHVQALIELLVSCSD